MSKITNEQKYKDSFERMSAYKKYEDARGYNITVGGLLNWLALEAEEENPEPCFYCGGKVHLDDNGPMLFYIQCNCGYRSRDFTRRDIAIAEHNRVARAVMASKKK